MVSPRKASVLLALSAVTLALCVRPSVSQGDDATPEEAQPVLIFVAELCRHGDRAPIFEFPSDALPVSRWPEGAGQLTAIGQRAHFDIGTRLRSKYVDSGFLSSSYRHDEIYVRSSDVDRTLMSAQSQLTGLYPPGTNPNYDVRVRFGKDALHDSESALPHLFQPIPIHTEATTKEQVLLPGANCPRHLYLQSEKKRHSDFLKKAELERDFIRTVARIAKVPDVENFSIKDMHHIWDTWTCFAAHGVPLPDGATPEIVQHAKDISDWMLDYANRGRELHRLRAGLTLHTIARYMAMAALRHNKRLPTEFKGSARKFLFLSAHDTTVAATLAAMRVFNGKYPPYNSTVFWELYANNDSSLSVRIEYNGDPIVLPGCDSAMCNIDQYIKSTIEATVQGEDARWLECQVGWRRVAARAGSLFYRNRATNFEELLRASPADGSSASTNAMSFGLLIFLTLGVIALVGILSAFFRLRGSHGYVRPQGDKSEYDAAEAELIRNRRVLI